MTWLPDVLALLLAGAAFVYVIRRKPASKGLRWAAFSLIVICAVTLLRNMGQEPDPGSLRPEAVLTALGVIGFLLPGIGMTLLPRSGRRRRGGGGSAWTGSDSAGGGDYGGGGGFSGGSSGGGGAGRSF